LGLTLAYRKGDELLRNGLFSTHVLLFLQNRSILMHKFLFRMLVGSVDTTPDLQTLVGQWILEDKGSVGKEKGRKEKDGAEMGGCFIGLWGGRPLRWTFSETDGNNHPIVHGERVRSLPLNVIDKR